MPVSDKTCSNIKQSCKPSSAGSTSCKVSQRSGPVSKQGSPGLRVNCGVGGMWPKTSCPKYAVRTTYLSRLCRHCTRTCYAYVRLVSNKHASEQDDFICFPFDLLQRSLDYSSIWVQLGSELFHSCASFVINFNSVLSLTEP